MKTPKWGMAAVVLFMALSMLFMVVPVSASPDVYPCNFFGTASVDGTPVAAGTEISAWFEGLQVASAVTGAGSLADNEYSLVVNLDEVHEGEAVSFKIGTLWASETGTWQKLMAVEVNLTAFTGADTTPPEVISTSPVNGATGVAVGTSVTATFNEPIDEATIVFTLDSVAGNVTYADTTATFDPIANLAYSTTYTASIQASDLAGNPMTAPYTWSFTTRSETPWVPPEPSPDITPPEVIDTSPVDGATGVAVGTSVTATFNEPIDEATIVFTLENVACTRSCADTTATLCPVTDLSCSTTYTASIQASDLAGNPMTAPYTWSFTTQAAPAEVPEEPVPVARLSVGNLRISPQQPIPTQAVTISVDVTNYGDRWGSKVLTLMINGLFEQSTSVGVSPHTSTTVSFTVYRAVPGQYSVDIEGVTGWFSVGELKFVRVSSDEGLGTGDIIAIVVIAVILLAGIIVAFLVARR